MSVDRPGFEQGPPWLLAEDVVELGAADRDRQPFAEFYRREFARTRALARALAGPQVCDDVAQEAMLVAFRRWRHVSHLQDPAMWVRRVCANLSTSQLRRRGVESRALVRLGSRISPAVLDGEDDAFWSMVRTLPRRQAQALTLYYLFDLSVAEVAETLQLREGSVKSHLARGRAALSQRLSSTEGELS